MVDDKDVKAVLDLLPPKAYYYFTQAYTHRAIPADRICQLATERRLQGQVFHSVKKAYRKAMEDSDADDFIFVGGSSYVVADFLS